MIEAAVDFEDDEDCGPFGWDPHEGFYSNLFDILIIPTLTLLTALACLAGSAICILIITACVRALVWLVL